MAQRLFNFCHEFLTPVHDDLDGVGIPREPFLFKNVHDSVRSLGRYFGDREPTGGRIDHGWTVEDCVIVLLLVTYLVRAYQVDTYSMEMVCHSSRRLLSILPATAALVLEYLTTR
jgi:hypothetical protein